MDWSIKEGWSRFFEKVGAGNLPKYMAKENTSQEFRLKEKKQSKKLFHCKMNETVKSTKKFVRF